MYSSSIQNLISELKKLPSVGERTAERYVFHWLKAGKASVGELKNALDELLIKMKSCKTCWNFSDSDPCQICADKNRDHTTICVVLEPQDLMAIESTGVFKGVYHLLRELIDSLDESSLSKTKIPELLERIKSGSVKEIILALNPNLEGETTAMYIESKIKNQNPNVKITKLAKGLPMGSDLQYADEITLGSALKNRL